MPDWRNLSHCALIAMAVIGMSGCTQWRVAPGPSRDALTGVGERRVRLLLRDGRQVEMHAPRIIGDSLVGYEAVREKGERRAVAVSQVSQVEVQTADGSRTLLTIGLLAVGVAAAWIAWLMIGLSSAHT